MLILLDASPVEGFEAMFKGAFGSTDALTSTALKATPLLFVGVGITIAFRANVINIGGEGQMVAGAPARHGASRWCFPTGRRSIMLPAVLIAGIVGGAIWGAVPGALKAYYGVNEILSTIMLNVVAVQLMNYLLRGPMIDPGEIERGTRIPQTERLQEGADLPLLFGSGRLHIGPADRGARRRRRLHPAVAHAGRVPSYAPSVRAPTPPQYAGIPVKRTIVLAMTLSGAMGGLAGAVLVFGSESHRMVTDGSTAGFTGSAGFNGIVAALVRRPPSTVDDPGLVPLRRTPRRRQRAATGRAGADGADPRPQRARRRIRGRQRPVPQEPDGTCLTGRDGSQARRRNGGSDGRGDRERTPEPSRPPDLEPPSVPPPPGGEERP